MQSHTTTHTIPLAALQSVKQPIGSANGMPNAAYTDAHNFTFERDHIMGKHWTGLAFASELPENGYVKPIDFMGLPLALMRGQNGEINVFHNVCSHRGMKLVPEEKKLKGMVVCPYHSWTYDFDGELKATPHIGGVGKHKAEGFSCENHGLKAVRSRVWAGIIFINLSNDAVEFDEFIQPLLDRWEAFTGKGGFEQIRVASNGSKMDLTVHSNWKFAVENYCEAYHLPWVHPALNSYSPLDQHYNLVVNDYLSGQGTNTYNLTEVAGTSMPQFADWPQEKIRQAEYLSLYPNVLLGVQADHVFAIILQPLANNRTLEKLELSYVGDESLQPEYDASREAILESWRVVFTEDIFAVEGMQQGRESPAYNGGTFSPVLDEPSLHFHQWVADQYLSA